MGDKLGIIAGSGKIPFFLYQEAKKKGYECVVVGIRGETEVGLQELIPVFEWFDLDRVLDIVAFFQREEIRHVLLGGKIDPLRILMSSISLISRRTRARRLLFYWPLIFLPKKASQSRIPLGFLHLFFLMREF